VRVEDFDTLEDGRPFMAMEYVNGRSLRYILIDKKLLPAERAAQHRAPGFGCTGGRRTN